MAMNYKEISGRLPSRYKTGGRAVNDLVDSLVEQGMLPVALGEKGMFLPEVPLEPLWRRQVDRLIALGFHKELGMTEEVYRASLPKFASRPREAIFDMPLLIDKNVPFNRQAELAGLEVKVRDIVDISDSPTRNYAIWGRIKKCPEIPYDRFIGYNVVDGLQDLESHEDGATVLEGLSLYIHYPHIRYGHLFLPGSRVFNFGIPYLQTAPVSKRLGYISIINPDYIGQDDPVGILTRSQRINIAA